MRLRSISSRFFPCGAIDSECGSPKGPRHVRSARLASFGETSLLPMTSFGALTSLGETSSSANLAVGFVRGNASVAKLAVGFVWRGRFSCQIGGWLRSARADEVSLAWVCDVSCCHMLPRTPIFGFVRRTRVRRGCRFGSFGAGVDSFGAARWRGPGPGARSGFACQRARGAQPFLVIIGSESARVLGFRPQGRRIPGLRPGLDSLR
jgi:hypothetical protein